MIQSNTEIHPTNGKRATRVDWEVNHDTILESYLRLYSADPIHKTPTRGAIARDTGLSEPTVQRHIRKISVKDVAPMLKMRVGPILNALADRAESGEPAAVKLYMQLVYGWKETTANENQENYKIKVELA